MNKNVVIGVAAVAVLGLAGYIVYTKLKKPATGTSATGTPSGTTSAPATGTNANQTNWLTTIGGLFGDLGHLTTGNSTSPTNNTTTANPVVTDNGGTSWDSTIGGDDGFDY